MDISTPWENSRMIHRWFTMTLSWTRAKLSVTTSFRPSLTSSTSRTSQQGLSATKSTQMQARTLTWRSWSVLPFLANISVTPTIMTLIHISCALRVPSKFMTMHKQRDSNMCRTYRRSITRHMIDSYKNAKKSKILETSRKNSLDGRRRSKILSLTIINCWRNRIILRTRNSLKSRFWAIGRRRSLWKTRKESSTRLILGQRRQRRIFSWNSNASASRRTVRELTWSTKSIRRPQ